MQKWKIRKGLDLVSRKQMGGKITRADMMKRGQTGILPKFSFPKRSSQISLLMNLQRPLIADVVFFFPSKFYNAALRFLHSSEFSGHIKLLVIPLLNSNSLTLAPRSSCSFHLECPLTLPDSKISQSMLFCSYDS